jgi:MraZ protein
VAFRGHADNHLDAKGRMAVPAKMRRALSPEAEERFVATRGFERCVHLYPRDEWERMEAEFRKLNGFDPRVRYFLNMMQGWAEDVALDSQGRVMIPRTLCDFAGLTPGETVRINGALDYITVWSPEAWTEFEAAQAEQFGALAFDILPDGTPPVPAP